MLSDHHHVVKKCYRFSEGRLCQFNLWQIDTRRTTFILWQYHPKYLICNPELVSHSFCRRCQPGTGRGTLSLKGQACRCWGTGHTGKGQTCPRILSGLSPGCDVWSRHTARSSPNPRWATPGRQPFGKQLPDTAASCGGQLKDFKGTRAYTWRCITQESGLLKLCLCYGHMYVHSCHTHHCPDLKDKTTAELSEELLTGVCFTISMFFLFFSYLKVNHHRIFFCWFQPICEDCVSWKSPFFLPGQSCCILWHATFYQREWPFSWLQNGTWKGISSQYCQTKASKDSRCNNRVLGKSEEVIKE